MRLAALVLVLVAGVGCAQYMAIKAPGPIDRDVLQPGAERTRVAATFGAPIVTNEAAPGKVIDTYNYSDGGKRNTTLPKAGRVILYTAGDVFTLFLDQVLWMPAELLMDGTDYSANVEYQQRSSDRQWIATRITETKLGGDQAVRMLELDPSAAATLLPLASPASVQTSSGSGTCFAVSGDGVLLTASHVVGGNSAQVTLADGRELSATVERRAVALDIALLRVNAQTPDHLSFGDARAVRVGQRAFTLGYTSEAPAATDASRIDASITSLTGPDGDPTYIGIQVPAQPESSGEPLVDERGQVVGMVTANGPLLPVSASAGAAPEANNHAVNAVFILPIVGEVAPLPPTVSYDDAVARARAALCRVNPQPPAVERTQAPAVATPTAEAANSH